MKAFILRLIIVLFFFFLASFVITITGKEYLGLPVWLTAVTLWTLHLGFRKSLFITLPFLIFADILWDGELGPLSLCGFGLAALITFLSVRTETRASLFQMSTYSLMITVFSLLVVAFPFFWQYQSLSWIQTSLLISIFVWQFLLTLLVYAPINALISRAEQFLDTSYRDQIRKIR